MLKIDPAVIIYESKFFCIILARVEMQDLSNLERIGFGEI
jgi:hypothetical protein